MSKREKDAGQVLAEYVACTRSQELDPSAIETAKRSFLDTFGVMVGATGTVPGLQELNEMFNEMGGSPDSTVLGFGGRIPAPNAAFLNGAFSHGLDYDDTHDGASCHPSAPVVAAALALAESIGGVNGADLVAAIALGQDVFCRLAAAVSPLTHQLHTALTLGNFAVAATCGRLLKLDAEQMFNAFGLAACRVGAPSQLSISEGSNLRVIYNAFPARDGLLAAMMAGRGLGGINDLFEGPLGLFKSHFGGQYDRDQLLGGLGETYAATAVSYKPWPSCRVSHPYIDATLTILREQALSATDVKKVTVYVTQMGQNLCEPVAARRRPQTVANAKFSIPFTVGLALAKQSVSIGDFSEDALVDPNVLSQADKVEHSLDARLETKSGGIGPGAVSLETIDGQEHVKRVDFALGHPSNPLDQAALREKFRDCLAHAAAPVTDQTCEELLSMMSDLEGVTDLRDLTALVR